MAFACDTFASNLCLISILFPCIERESISMNSLWIMLTTFVKVIILFYGGAAESLEYDFSTFLRNLSSQIRIQSFDLLMDYLGLS